MSAATWIYVGVIVLYLAVVFPMQIRTHRSLRSTWRTMAGTWRTMARTARLQGRTESAVKYERHAAECDHKVRHWWTA